jgi:hypothetical protein
LGTRTTVAWPARRLLKPAARWLLRIDTPRVPQEWQQSFMDHVLEPRLAADVLRARRPGARRLKWLERIVAEPTFREIAHVVLDQSREARADRLRRENVDISLFAGRAWSFEHRSRPHRPSSATA